MKEKTNIFRWEPHLQTIAFTTESGHLSGILMKNIQYRRPEIIEELQRIVKETSPRIGDVITIKNYSFVILRKHYNNKITEKTFSDALHKAFPSLEHFSGFKTTDEDFPRFVEILKAILPKIEIRTR